MIEVLANATLEIRDRDFAALGEVTILQGGSIEAANGISLGSSKVLYGNGLVAGRFSGASGSTIEADGSLIMGETSPNGFSHFGEMRVGSTTISLMDSNQAVLGAGSLTTLAGGTLDAESYSAGVLVDFGASVLGTGTIMAPNDPFRFTTLNGSVNGQDWDFPIYLGGFVKGVGTFDYVIFTGTHSPGFSPTLSYVGNFGYGPNATAIMEIGGTTPGSEFDKIVSSGSIRFDGTLSVDLINGFMPSIGQIFDLYDGNLSGEFDILDLPALSTGLAWDTSNLYSMGQLGIVAIPEPTTLGLLAAASTLMLRRRSK